MEPAAVTSGGITTSALAQMSAHFNTVIGSFDGTKVTVDESTPKPHQSTLTDNSIIRIDSWRSNPGSVGSTSSFFPRITQESRAEKASAAITDFAQGFNAKEDTPKNISLIKKVIASRIASRAAVADKISLQAGIEKDKAPSPALDEDNELAEKIIHQIRLTISHSSSSDLTDLRTKFTTAADKVSDLKSKNRYPETGIFGSIGSILNRRAQAAAQAAQLRAQEKLTEAALNMVLKKIDQEAASKFSTTTQDLASGANLINENAVQTATSLQNLDKISAPSSFLKGYIFGRTWKNRLEERTNLAATAQAMIAQADAATKTDTPYVNRYYNLKLMGVEGACLLTCMTTAYKDVIDKHALAVSAVEAFSKDKNSASLKIEADTALKEVDKAMAKAEKMESLLQQHIQTKQPSSADLDGNTSFFFSLEFGDLLEALFNS